jgi:cytoskeletal protein CcmA (bactofilin family)
MAKNDLPTPARPSDPPFATVIGPGLSIKGELASEEAVDLAGTLEGHSTVAAHYRVRTGGCVIGTIEARTLDVEGTVQTPQVVADKVEIGASGRLDGRVRTRRVAIAAGAAFEGELEMDDERGGER